MECNEEGTFRNTNEAPEYEKKKWQSKKKTDKVKKNNNHSQKITFPEC